MRCSKATRIMDSEQSQNFNERLNQWVANQGFWFQVRYSLSGSGIKGHAMFHLLRLGFRLLLLLLIAAVGIWIYLMKRADSKHFKDALREDLQAGLTASKLEMGGGQRMQGYLEISRLAAEGEDSSFFATLEARNIRCQMGLLDGLMGRWKPGVISISRLNIDLRAGADNAESAHQLADAWFRKSAQVEANAFEVADATVRWGYSERTQGAIESSALTMNRTETGWRMNFQGGLFHQNWLSNLEIVHLVVACDADGLVVEKAELRQGEATVDFTGLRLIGGDRPQVEGTVKIRNMALEAILPPAMRIFLEGSISGDFRVFGSTNSSDGIGFEAQVVMAGKDMISLREQIYLLKALSVVDYSRNYHRVDFREGSIHMKTTRGGMELSEVKLKAGDLFTLEGKMSVRLPTQEEIQTAVAKGSGSQNSLLFAEGNLTAKENETAKEESAFTLRQAALEARRLKEGTQSVESPSLFERLDTSIELRRLQSHEAERMSRMLRYEGAFRITIPGDAFERGPELQRLYPVDGTTGRIPLMVPIEGNLYELTLQQAEDIYKQGKR